MVDIKQQQEEEIDETAYLMRSPENAKRLSQSISELEDLMKSDVLVFQKVKFMTYKIKTVLKKAISYFR